MNPAGTIQDLKWRVLKFGGSSVARADNWPRIIEQIRQARKEGFTVAVVVSALRGVTDLLQAHIDSGRDASAHALHEQVRQRHAALLLDCELPGTTLDGPMARLGDFLEREFDAESPTDQARLLAFGEILSSHLAVARLGAGQIPSAWLDSRKVLISDELEARNRRARYLSARCRAQPDHELAARLAAESGVWVMPGFVAANAAGETVLLGRGGSDTSATALAAVLGARRVDIFSDVPGLFSADPRRVAGARLLRQVSFGEARELAAMGAKALHPAALLPAREHDIEIHMRQTDRPDIAGTRITPAAREHGAQVKAIVERKPIIVISLEGIGMWQQVGFLAAVFTAFAELGLSVDQVSTSEANVTVTIDPDAIVADRSLLDALSRRLSRLCSVEIFSDCASVSLVGKGIRTVLHRLGPALEIFGQRRIFQISQAANDLNLSFVVESRHAERLVAQFHQQLIPGGIGGDSVFGPTFEQLFGGECAPDSQRPWWQARRPELLELMAGRDCAYVHDLPTMRAAAGRLAALGAVDRVFYSMKANPHAACLKAAADAGFGIGCASLAEACRARALLPELRPADILFTPSFAPRAEYRQAIAMGLTVTVDSLHVLKHWGEDLAGAAVFLRLDPDSAPGYHRIARTAGANAKFGLPANDFERAIELCDAQGIRIFGLHAHTGSGVMQPANWHRSLEILAEAAARIDTVEVINLGGGLGVPARADELPLDLAALDAGLARLRQALPRPLKLWIEPGRYLVADAGVLLARVTQIKDKGERRYVGVATGMNSLIRPALYGAWHEIINLSRAGEAGHQVCDIVGPISESADVFGLDRLLPTTHEGDILLIANAGAYGAAMASRYNLRDPAAEFVLE